MNSMTTITPSCCCFSFAGCHTGTFGARNFTKKTSGGQGLFWFGRGRLKIVHSHRIHVWYIYLHSIDFYGINVGKYTIHGSYGIHLTFLLAGIFKKLGP